MTVLRRCLLSVRGDKMINKLKSTSGESIAETLVAVLISAFALLMLAGTINTASRLITGSQTKLEEYYSKNNELADVSASRMGTSVSISGRTTDSINISEAFSAVPYKKIDKSDSSIVGSKKLIAYG